MTYVLKSSIAGEVIFLHLWKENQTVTNGENAFTVISTNDQSYIGKIKATPNNSGKIKVGQKVNIRLASYPDSEFGTLQGVIAAISPIPDNEGHILIDVALPNKLQTSYNKTLEFQQEMSGTADITTEDLRIIERLLYQMRDIFNAMDKQLKQDNL